MKIFIYKLPELEIISEYFETPSPEMDMFDLFSNKLNSNYEIVDTLQESDIAFIPIDYVKLIYGRVKHNQWHNAYTTMHNACGQNDLIPKSQPPTIGIGEKEKYIKFFWDYYVKNNINLNLGIPHFILYNYVLFEVSFESIDRSVSILSYEEKVSIYNSPNVFDLGVKDRTIPIPYIQNKNEYYNLPQIDSHNTTIKEFNLSFIGTVMDNNRPVLTSSRSFMSYLKNRVYFSNLNSITDTLSKTKYLFVLRGDTPSRVNFYQCFSHNVVPIIFNDEVTLYSKVLSKKYPINDCCLVLPNKGGMNDYEYSQVVDSIISNELSNNQNYLNRIKNHKDIFSEVNYFSKECYPIQNALKKIKLNANSI